MRRILTIAAVTALIIGVSVPAAALPTLTTPAATAVASRVTPQVFVAAGQAAATAVVRDTFTVEMLPKQPPVVVVASVAGSLAMWPASGPINDRFGYRGEEFHKGVDIMAPAGSPFVAASPGVVTTTGWEAGWGWYVVVEHANGVKTLYSHAIEGSFMVSVGQTVDAGTPLALVGQTGYVTAPLLHFEVYVSGVPVDPEPWLP